MKDTLRYSPARDTTHQVGSSTNTPGLYSGGARFESQLEHRLCGLSVVVFLSPSRKIWNSTLNEATVASTHILPNSPFTIIGQPFDAVWFGLLTASLNILQINNKRAIGLYKSNTENSSARELHQTLHCRNNCNVWKKGGHKAKIKERMRENRK
jgi:hypothetical protein